MSADTARLISLVMGHNLHPELGLHPSWLPRGWPARHRVVARLGPSGRATLGDLLRQDEGAGNTMRFEFDSPLSRLVLLDGTALRRLAVYTGLCVHRSALRQRGPGNLLRRQARRYDTDAVEFVLERMPHVSEIRMNLQGLQERPHGAGRIVVDRGHRLLMAALAGEGAAIVQRVQRKLPRRLSALSVPELTDRQAGQLREVLLKCLVPERLPQWDWLF